MTDTLIHTLSLNTRGVISIIGAGGKTSLMFRLAKELKASEKTVLTTTTTKIFLPGPDQSPFTLIEKKNDALLKKLKSGLEQYPHFSAGRKQDLRSGKLNGFPPEIIDDLWQAGLFDWIIVEADGARQKSLKATNSREPVIPKSTRHLILVTGLDAVGCPLDDDHVHRAGIFSKNTGLCIGDTIDEKAVAAAINIEMNKACAQMNIHSTLVFLNKADTRDKIKSGGKIKHMLQSNRNIHRIITASLQIKLPVRNHIEPHPTNQRKKE